MSALSGVDARPADRTAPPGGGSPVRVAVLDRDTGFLNVLLRRLAAVGFEHRVLGGGTLPRDLVAMRLTAVVLDPSALGPYGWTYLQRVCRELPTLPVVVCSGPSTVSDRVRGLRLGADDWLTKPCHPEELIARLEAVIRRRRRAHQAHERNVSAGEIEIRPRLFQAFVGERSVDLTRREFELLHVLADGVGRVLTRDEIYQRVWGYAMVHGDRSVDVFVRKLRKKLSRASPGWRYVHTHFGVGYRFAAEPADDPSSAPFDAEDAFQSSPA